MAWVTLVKRSECFEETQYAFDVSTGRRFIPSPDIDARYRLSNTTTDEFAAKYWHWLRQRRTCVRHVRPHER